MEIKFIQALSSELGDALYFFKLASQNLSDKNVDQWSYWVDPPEEKIKWVKEGFEKGEFFFVYDLKGTKIAMFRLLNTDTLYWGKKGLEKSVRYIHSFVVLPAYSGRGKGKTIMFQIIDRLQQENVHKLRLDCDGANQRLCQYYENYGFIKVGEKTTNYSVNNLYEMSLNPNNGS